MGRRFVQQSAMEYLMTYGWAILIIAIVVVALYSFGLLNAANFMPRSQAGSCQVFRPSGARTTTNINDVGTCNNELPEYVAQFSGQNSYVSLGNGAAMSPEAGANGNMTMCIWYMALSATNWHGFIIKGASSPSNGGTWEYAIGQGNSEMYIVWNAGGSNIAGYGAQVPAINSWHFTCFTYDYPAGNSFVYIDGQQYSASFSTPTGPATQGTGALILGAGENGYSNVDLANFQLYNASLSASAIEKLYLEGIGGAPVSLQNLVGWWPLNGNIQDYSGNGYSGSPVGISYVSTWTNGYSIP